MQKLAALINQRTAQSVFSEITAQDDLQPVYKCAQCQDRGGYIVRKKNGYFIRGTEIEQDYWAFCSCLAQLNQTVRLTQSSVLIASEAFTFDHFSENVATPVVGMKRLAIRYVENFESIRQSRQNSLALLGQSGAGKTHLLVAVLNRLIAQGEHIKYCTYTELLEQIARDQFANAAQVMETYRTVPVLVIDDVFKPISGRASVRAWEAMKLFDLVNYRYMHNLPILFSSELTYDELFHVDEAIASRLFEMTQDFIWTVPKKPAYNYRLAQRRGTE